MPSTLSSRRSLLSGIAGLALGAAAPLRDHLRMSVAEFGVTPGINDAGPGVRAAIRRLGKRPGSTLYFPAGTYRFAAREGVAMPFENLDDLTIAGDGATLLFNGEVAPLLMRGCRAPSVKGLIFDWERPPFSQGEVTEVARDGRSLVLRVDPDFPIEGDEKVKELGTYDRRTRAMRWHGTDFSGTIVNTSAVGSQLLRLSLKRPVPLKPGDTVVARHGGGPPVVRLVECHDFSIQDVAIYAGPSMGIAAGGCDRGLLQRVRVQQKPGSGRLMSTDEDGLHCASCSGELKVAECSFSGMGDDGINVTGLYLPVIPTKRRRTFELAGGRLRPPPYWIAPKAGDRLLLVSGATLKPLAEVQIANVETKRNDERWSVQLVADPPALEGDRVFAIDLQRATQLHVSHCEFPGNRARGVLAHSDAVIEHCTFEHQSNSAIILAPDMFWQEGPAVERTVVRNNTMRAGDLLQTSPAAVWIGAFVSPAGRQGVPAPTIVNQNVAVEGNVFRQPNGAAVAAAATSDLRIEGNQIEQASAVAFSLDNVRNAHLLNNRCDPSSAIQVDAASRHQLTLSGNMGLRVI
jgi:hypothetical protein